MFLARQIFFLFFDTFSADSSCRLLSYTHTKGHDWTSTQASKYWHMAVDILSARWLIVKRTSLTADIATNIIQEGRIYHRKRELPLINACRWEHLQCCCKAIPTRGSIYCVCSWHKHGHTRRRKLGLHLQLQDERERGEKGKRQEYRREHELRMRAQQTNKSGHEYQCKRTVEYTTVSAVRVVATCVDGMNLHRRNVFIQSHQERK